MRAPTLLYLDHDITHAIYYDIIIYYIRHARITRGARKSTQSMGSTFGCIDKMMISMGLQAPRQAPASSQPASPASPPSYNASAVSAPGLQVAEFCGQCGAPVTAPFCGGCGTATGFSNSPT